MKKDSTLTVGLLPHKDSIAVCWLEGDSPREQTREIPNDPRAIQKLLKWLASQGELRVCYEAGPCGYEVQRQLRKMGIRCEVIAPAMIPRRPGERIKTDRRDARKLARLYRAAEAHRHPRTHGGRGGGAGPGALPRGYARGPHPPAAPAAQVPAAPRAHLARDEELERAALGVAARATLRASQRPAHVRGVPGPAPLRN